MLSMNDAHIYCTIDQVAQEVGSNVKMVQDYYAAFGFEDYSFRLSLWDPKKTEKYIDQPENWKKSEDRLRQIMDDLGVVYTGQSVRLHSTGQKSIFNSKLHSDARSLCRPYNLILLQKERFGLSYMDENGNQNDEVLVIHRAPLSTHERFVAFLTEHWMGNFPTWISPTQVQIITISERHADYAGEVASRLREHKVEVAVDDSDSTIGRKIRTHRKMRPAYMLIIGDGEAADGTVSIRARNGDQRNGVPLEDFIVGVTEEINNRSSKLILV